MAYTNEDLTAVQRAIAKGERAVTFADRSVTYRSMEELLAAEQHILRELGTTRPKQFIGIACKGF